jgi:hypothetical protein
MWRVCVLAHLPPSALGQPRPDGEGVRREGVHGEGVHHWLVVDAHRIVLGLTLVPGAPSTA